MDFDTAVPETARGPEGRDDNFIADSGGRG
jgi:hypothetical protein